MIRQQSDFDMGLGTLNFELGTLKASQVPGSSSPAGPLIFINPFYPSFGSQWVGFTSSLRSGMAAQLEVGL